MKKTTVLLVDDHAVVRDGLKRILTETGNNVIVAEAADGRTAVLRARETKPDVVVMDIAMPELNGIEATKQILVDSPGSRVVILSMLDTSEHLFRALEAGAMGYVLKESAGRDVSSAVAAAARNENFFSAPVLSTLLADYMKTHDRTSSPLASLNGREREVLQLVVEGHSSAEAARILDLSTKTVETYRSRLMSKLGIHDIPGLVKFAVRTGITPV